MNLKKGSIKKWRANDTDKYDASYHQIINKN